MLPSGAFNSNWACQYGPQPKSARLEASVNPLKKSGEYYFVADGTGRHHFSRTYSEHLQAKHRIKYGAVPESIRSKPGPATSDAPGQETSESSEEAVPESETDASLETKQPKQGSPDSDPPSDRDEG